MPPAPAAAPGTAGGLNGYDKGSCEVTATKLQEQVSKGVSRPCDLPKRPCFGKTLA
jgi:hypothetical protein